MKALPGNPSSEKAELAASVSAFGRAPMATPDDNDARVFILAPQTQVLTREFLRELARKMEALKLSRLKSIDWLDRRLFHDLKTPVEHSDGRPFNVHRDIIEEAYGWSDEYRWNTDIKRHAKVMPKRAPNKSLLLRLYLWDIAFKVAGDPVHI